MAYATVAQLLERYDLRTIGDLAADNNTQVSSGALPTDPNVLAALNDASGEIDSALLVGGMYTPAQLEALAGNSQFKLVRLCCRIAIVFIHERRHLLEADELEKYEKINNDALARLRKGENLFDIAANVGAGKPSVDGPSTVEYQGLNLVRDRVQRTYPARMLPHNR